MELSYKNFYVKKFSHGNSFAIEEDVENKKFKVRFINKWSILFFALLAISIITITTLMIVYRNSSTLYKYTKSRPVERKKNEKIFHIDKYVNCQAPSNPCKSAVELKKDYVDQLSQALKAEKVEVIEAEGFLCSDPTRDEYCETISGLSWGVTRKELEAMAEALVDKNIALDLKFEVGTILKFKKFVKTFKKVYETLEDYKKRYLNFRRNRIRIETHNSDPGRLYTMGYTSPSDGYESELDNGVLDNRSVKYVIEKDELLTKSYGPARDPNYYPGKIFDWRDKGVVLPVRDQGLCGSCWAFSSTDLLSSMVALQTKKLKEFSVQQLMDCAMPHFVCEGGGVPAIAFVYMNLYPLCTEEEYPYKMSNYMCRQPNNCTNSFKVEYKELRYKDIVEYLEKEGPFILLMNATNDFTFYKEGIFPPECSRRNNHGVLVVGHGHDPTLKVNYWIVKNSWTKNWGEDGYFRLLNDYDVIDGKRHFYCNMDKLSMGITVK